MKPGTWRVFHANATNGKSEAPQCPHYYTAQKW